MALIYKKDKSKKASLLTEALGLNQDIPLSSPINGNQKIRTDIKVKKSLTDYTIVRSQEGKYPDELKDVIYRVFDNYKTGTFIKTSTTKSKEGGESANPMFILSENFLGG